MKALGVDDLQTILDGEMVWRRREISSIITLARSNSDHVALTLVRASIPMLYAHWEGFGKECIIRCLEFVSYRKIKYKFLHPAFLYLASISSLSSIGTTGVKQALEVIEGFSRRSDATNKDNFRKKISTKSNLRSDVLKDLLLSCGLEVDWVSEYEDFINRDLCDPRNEIAHGGGAGPSLEVFLRRRDKAFELMTLLQTNIVNAAVNGGYQTSKKSRSFWRDLVDLNGNSAAYRFSLT